MLHRTQWSLLLIWKARFRVTTTTPPNIMSKGALTIPGFAFTNFVAGSSGQIECVSVCQCVGMLFFQVWMWNRSVCELLNLIFFSLWEVKGASRPDTMKQNPPFLSAVYFLPVQIESVKSIGL